MSALSNYLRNMFLNAALRNTAFTTPTNLYLALWVGDPTDDGNGGVEVAGGGYQRQLITFAAPSGDAVSSSSTVTYPVPSADWGTITNWAIFDAQTGGNVLLHGAFDQALTVKSGNVAPTISAGALTIQVV